MTGEATRLDEGAVLGSWSGDSYEGVSRTRNCHRQFGGEEGIKGSEQTYGAQGALSFTDWLGGVDTAHLGRGTCAGSSRF